MKVDRIKTTKNIGRRHTHTPAHECTIGFTNGYRLSVAGSGPQVDRAATAFEEVAELDSPILAMVFLGKNQIVALTKEGGAATDQAALRQCIKKFVKGGER